MKEWTRLKQTSKIKFSMARLWVKAYNVSDARQTKTFAQFLGSRIGSFVDCGETFMLGADRSLCFRVDIDVEKPLHRSVRVLVEGR